MKTFIKENTSIVVAFVLPLLIIVVVALNTYAPSFFVSTEYNFVYAVCDSNNRYYSGCNEFLERKYSVVDGKIIDNGINSYTSDIQKIAPVEYKARVFFYNSKTNESREISLDEMEVFSELLTSPDGVTVSNSYTRSNGDIFNIFGFGGSSYGQYFVKGNRKRKLNVVNNDGRYYYQNNFRFIGWTEHEPI